MFTKSSSRRLSRYVQGGITDIFAARLGWWERRVLKESVDDITFIVEKHMEGRPDLISHVVYGTRHYSWLVLQYNNIVDVNDELIQGRELTLPRPTRVTREIATRPISGRLKGK